MTPAKQSVLALPLHPTAREAWPGSGPLLLLRPRLLKRLRLGIRGPLTVLNAPAGYGKSVLLQQLAAQGPSTRAVPVTLPWTDGMQRVHARLVASGPGWPADRGPLVAALPPAGAELPDLAAALRAWPEDAGDVVVVLDGLEGAPTPSLADELGSALGAPPRGLHVLVACRPPALAAPDAPDPATAVVIDAGDLAFTEAEVRLLVRQVAGRELTDEQVAALMARTAGWAVGVREAAVGLRAAGHPDDIIAGLHGTERHVAAFLRDEVLDRQPAPLRRFLARTSVLDTLSAPLCRAVAGETAPEPILRLLERGRAFLSPVATPEADVAWCGLFRETLRRELRMTEPGAEAVLLGAAAAWHADRGEPEPAARYLVEAERWDELIELLDRHGPALLERGAAGDIVRWLAAVPPGPPRRRHRAGLRRAFALTLAGEALRAAQVVRGLDGAHLPPGERAVVDVLRATWAFTDATPAAAVHAADAALAVLGDGSIDIPNVLGVTTRSDLVVWAGTARARALWYLGDVAGARRDLGALAGRTDAQRPWRAQALGTLALLEAWEGDLDDARRHAARALGLTTRGGPLEDLAVLDAHLALATVARDRGDLMLADELLTRADSLAVRTRRSVMLSLCTVERARWHLAAGQPERGLAAIRAHEAAGEAPAPPLAEGRLRAAEVRLLLALGQADRAERIVGAASEGHAPPLAGASVQTAIARRDLGAARRRLDRWRDGAGAGGAGSGGGADELERQLWEAIVDFEEGRRRQALRRAARVVAAARDGGHVRLVLDAGAPATRLLRSLANADPTPYAQRLLEAGDAPRAADGPTALILSAREREVVRYLPTPLSSAQIAGQLYISLNTLKTHLRTIYGKLGVKGRRDAIARAEELGIA